MGRRGLALIESLLFIQQLLSLNLHDNSLKQELPSVITDKECSPLRVQPDVRGLPAGRW